MKLRKPLNVEIETEKKTSKLKVNKSFSLNKRKNEYNVYTVGHLVLLLWVGSNFSTT